jgi:catechol 2,3-dioxygenase-like lactoylglutathione lyase family enzyme
MPNFIRITPFMHVPDVSAAVAFFTDTLGFRAFIHFPDYAYVQRETAAIRIMRASTCPGEEPGPGTHAFRYYIDVHDVNALYAELKPNLDALPTGSVHGPIDQTYGQREFMVLAPDGDLVVFGQTLYRMPGA